MKREQEIYNNISKADIILLLISVHFLANKFCREKQLKLVMEQHDADKVRVIPILLRPCDWENEKFAKLQGLPKDNKPVIKWNPRDLGYYY